MLVLMTTANFPDVMLPAYEKSWFYCIFFIGFLVVGMFFLLNMLLANIFNKFKERLNASGLYYLKRQSEFLELYINRFDEENKGYLTQTQTLNFFEELLGLKITEKRLDYDVYKGLFKAMMV